MKKKIFKLSAVLFILGAIFMGYTGSNACVLVTITEKDFDNILNDLVGDPGESKVVEVIERRFPSGKSYLYMIYKDGFYYETRIASSKKTFDNSRIKVLSATSIKTSSVSELSAVH